MEPRPEDRDEDAPARRRAVVRAGHTGELALLDASAHDPDAGVRAARLGALERLGRLGSDELAAACTDPDPTVRRRAATVAARRHRVGPGGRLAQLLVALLADDEPLVAEAAAWALGECGAVAAVPALGAMARQHPDARCREAAVAALGAIGDPAGLGPVLEALGDRPSVRRRAVVALAGFDGAEVEAALERCLGDRDWQVRQAAEILLGR